MWKGLMTAPSKDLSRPTGKEEGGGEQQIKIDKQIAK